MLRNGVPEASRCKRGPSLLRREWGGALRSSQLWPLATLSRFCASLMLSTRPCKHGRLLTSSRALLRAALPVEGLQLRAASRACAPCAYLNAQVCRQVGMAGLLCVAGLLTRCAWLV